MVELADPHTEADPVAVLAQYLAMFGSVIGQRPHAQVGATRHGTNLFVALAGNTSKARKGDSFGPPRAILERAEPDWLRDRVLGGIGSGEAVVWAVRDATEADPGEPDKRLLVFEPELARVLRVSSRAGSILSMVLRDAWDRGDLRTVTKVAPARAVGAHVSVVAHVTSEELRRELADVEVFNGFGNRFVWFVVRRSKCLPEPTPFDGPEVEELAQETLATIRWAAERDRLERDAEARELWSAMYPSLSEDRPGLVGAVLARAEAQVLRLSLVYALLDRSPVVRPAHLRSAVELWAYAERSVLHLFGHSTGDPVADRLLELLRSAGALDREEITRLTSNHISGARLDAALGLLGTLGWVRSRRVPTSGRPRQEWEAVNLPSLTSLPSQRYLAIARGGEGRV